MTVSILIADDHTLFREMLRQTLSGQGNTYNVIGEAADGPGTLTLVSRHRPDLVLLDYRMPGLDPLPIGHGAQKGPPQSTSVSEPFQTKSVQLGALHIPRLWEYKYR